MDWSHRTADSDKTGLQVSQAPNSGFLLLRQTGEEAAPVAGAGPAGVEMLPCRTGQN